MGALLLFLKMNWLQFAMVGLVLGGLWYVDHRGYKRAEDEAKLEQALARTEKLEADQRQIAITRKFETGLQDMVSRMDKNLSTHLSDIEVTNRTIIQPTLTKEIRNAPAQSNPDLGITDGMLRSINQARTLSWPSGSCTTLADGSATCQLSPARPVEGQEPSGAGQ